MNSAYNDLVISELSGNLQDDIYTFLVNNHCPKTAEHCMRVGQEARREVSDNVILTLRAYALDPAVVGHPA